MQMYYHSDCISRSLICPGATVLLGCFKLAMTLVAVVSVDRLGRRPLLLGGVTGIVLALVTLGATTPGSPSWLHLVSDPTSLVQLSALALLLFVGCYQVEERLSSNVGLQTPVCPTSFFATADIFWSDQLAIDRRDLSSCCEGTSHRYCNDNQLWEQCPCFIIPPRHSGVHRYEVPTKSTKQSWRTNTQ